MEGVFDRDAPIREASGSRGVRIFRSPDAPAEVVVLFESLENARQRVGSDAGVAGEVGKTEVRFLEVVGRLPT